jgi:hypothetical protein
LWKGFGLVGKLIDIKDWKEEKETQEKFNLYKRAAKKLMREVTPETFSDHACDIVSMRKDDDEFLMTYRIFISMIRYLNKDYYTRAALNPQWEAKVIDPIAKAITRKIERGENV